MTGYRKGMWTSLGIGSLLALLANGLLLCGGVVLAAETYTNPPLPVEGKPFHLVCSDAASAAGQTARFEVYGPDGSLMKQASVPFVKQGDVALAELEMTVPHNGMLRAKITAGGATLELTLPVISAKREVHLIYYGTDKRLFTEGYLHWVTMVTTAPGNAVAELDRRGIKALAWNWGSNHVNAEMKNYAKDGKTLTLGMAREMGYTQYTSTAQDAVKKGYDGYGLDEFGGYTGSAEWEHEKEYLRGIIDARPNLPKGFIIAAWAGGPLDPVLLGLYKQAADFLLPEAYLMKIAPDALGTQRQDMDLAGRLWYARANDLFTAPYGTRCKIIPCIDVGNDTPVDEYEPFFRMYRRDFPEVRGIGFFNTLSPKNWADYRAIDRLCFDYFVRPVVTFEPDNLGYDRFGKGGVVAWLSNIGAIDSGPVSVRLLVNGQVEGTARVKSVPAGFSLADDRAPLHFNWKPSHAGTYRLRVEITDCQGATVLDPAAETSLFLRP